MRIAKAAYRYILRLGARDGNGFDYTVTELVNMKCQSEKMTLWHGEVLSNSILDYKKSDTIFLLGSGPSINDLSSSHWEKISCGDSLGFNFWLIHDFVPNLFVFQMSGVRMADALIDNSNRYTNTPLIVRGSGFAKGEFFQYRNKYDILKRHKVFYLNEYPIHSRCSIDIGYLIDYMNYLGFLKFGQIGTFVPKWRSTAGLLVSLCYQMGYKKIVLCGFDMNDSRHFWDDKKYRVEVDRYNLPKAGESNIELFTKKSYSVNTVPEYLVRLRDFFYKNGGANIYVINKNTVLYPDLDLYDI